MWKFKNSKLSEKMKRIRVNRAVYLSSVVILLALAVVLAITAITNRAKREELPTPVPMDTPTVLQPSVDDENVNLPVEEPKEDIPTVLDVIPEFRLPVSGKLCKEHSADVPVFSNTLQDYRVHLGVDITTVEDAPVYAAASGTVAKIWEDPMMGYCIALKHTGNAMTVYKNLTSNPAVGISEGASVEKGQLLGTVGDSALSEIAEEPHLHLELTVNGIQVNPLDYFSSAVLASLSEDNTFEEMHGAK